MGYTPRLERPIKGNKFYITKSAGGYSSAITGKCKSTGKPDTQCNTLANCVGYAYGRFHEIANDIKMSYLSPVNAEDFPEYRKNCTIGNTPKLGAIIVWQKGKTAKSSDGAGHVAIVEEIISDTQIVISQSGYNSTEFWTEVCTKKNNEWTCSWMGTAYKFRCFIYNPKVSDNDKPVLKQGSKSQFVKDLQTKLNTIGNYKLKVDGSFGPATVAAVKDLQKQNKLTTDGIVGDTTWTLIDSLTNIETKPTGVIDLKLLVNNKQVSAWATVINNQNYIRLADLDDIGLAQSVSYNSTKKMPAVKTK